MNKSYTAVWEKNIAMNNTGSKNLVPACKQIDNNYYQLGWYQIFSLDYQGSDYHCENVHLQCLHYRYQH